MIVKHLCTAQILLVLATSTAHGLTYAQPLPTADRPNPAEELRRQQERQAEQNAKLQAPVERNAEGKGERNSERNIEDKAVYSPYVRKPLFTANQYVFCKLMPFKTVFKSTLNML